MKLIELTLINESTIIVNLEKIIFFKKIQTYDGTTILFNDGTKINVIEPLRDILLLIKEETK